MNCVNSGDNLWELLFENDHFSCLQSDTMRTKTTHRHTERHFEMAARKRSHVTLLRKLWCPMCHSWKNTQKTHIDAQSDTLIWHRLVTHVPLLLKWWCLTYAKWWWWCWWFYEVVEKNDVGDTARSGKESLRKCERCSMNIVQMFMALWNLY